ncbi:hypothetical protein AVEN_266267-1 [Araneus ventricosus]|uniref:Uncharacterized protein n=1 Tax=Araneus ventricosus TaxID=182803 RepID=A0A4Y2G6T6_ARAVE|nr:hypothetical protein AVEN_266267-1 [Araneus ventricosus]
MPHSCPRPCGRLATAAVFVSVGVIQFIAGLILLKSKYVYLLSGPDFWTAASNFAVGVLLGMSASVWKNVQKTSFKYVVRRNLLASLVVSAMIINSTTAIILILGEGNALLSIQLENDGKYSSTSEILAYSYATSVCSPIVSVVVAVVFLSGMCFRVGDKGMETPEIKSILKKNSINEYNWVFKGKQSPPKQDSKIVRKELSFKSLSSSSDDESFNLADAKLWSNSVQSIEYFNTSSRRGSHRMEMHRHGKVQQESACECGEHVKNLSETIPHETSRVSFADETKMGKFLKFSPYVSRSLLETDGPFSLYHIEAGDKNASSRSYAEFKKMHRHFENSKQRHKKKRILLTEHPAFQQSKLLEGNMNVQSFHKLESPEVYIPRVHTRMARRPMSSTTSEVKAEVHVDPENQDRVVNENTSESPIVHCEDDVPSSDTLTETVQHKKLEIQRSSTFKQMKNSSASQPEDNDTVDRKVCRTSTAAGPSSSNVSHLDISDIQNDSVIDQNEIYESEEEKDTSAVANPQPTASQMDSNTEIDDSFIDVPQSNELAGEVVKVQVNSLPRTPFHSKLIPVPIPIVSSVKKNALKRKQKDPITKATDKFSSGNEHRFSSFHGDIKSINQGSDHTKVDAENLMNQKYETVDDVTICEMSPDDNIPPSPAQTSGYDSAIFENTHLSGSECFKPNLSSSDTKSPYNTPKRKFQNFPFPRNLDNVHVAASE